MIKIRMRKISIIKVEVERDEENTEDNNETQKWQHFSEKQILEVNIDNLKAKADFKAGSIKDNLGIWKNLTHDREILEMVKGVKIKYLDSDPHLLHAQLINICI